MFIYQKVYMSYTADKIQHNICYSCAISFKTTSQKLQHQLIVL